MGRAEFQIHGRRRGKELDVSTIVISGGKKWVDTDTIPTWKVEVVEG